MGSRDQQQVTLTEEYWAALAQDPAAVPPAELDPDVALVARRLVTRWRPPEPEAAFASEFRYLLQAGTSTDPHRSPGTRAHAFRWPALRPATPRMWWALAGAAPSAGVLAALVVAGVIRVGSGTTAVSAAEVVDRAAAVAADPAAGGVSSFELLQVGTSELPGFPEVGFGTQVWYKRPDKWRFQRTFTSRSGQETDVTHSVTVGDGPNIWSFDPGQNSAQISSGSLGGPSESRFSLFGGGDLDAVLQQAKTCFDPVLEGEEKVAGRDAYVVDLGPTKCPSASGPEDTNGPRRIWVDKETFFVLKDLNRSLDGRRVVSTRAVASVRYNVDLPDDLFTFTPPPDATVIDTRPKPAPGADGFRKQLGELAAQVDFPLFASAEVPEGLAPRQPRSMFAQVWIVYVPPEQEETDLPAGQTGFTVIQQRATYEGMVRWTDGAEPVDIAGQQGWLRRGVRNADGTGTDSAALLVRDGTLIRLSSFRLSPEELVDITASLQPVPGGHAPLPNPSPPTLADVRERSLFPVFVPTWVPEGLTPEPPVGSEIRYHYPDGSPGLFVTNGPVGTGGLDTDPRKTGELVPLPNGVTAHFLEFPPELGGPILWWNQEGANIAMSGLRLSRDDLARIAAYMSSTADLGPTEPPPARPTPTPVPAPDFGILRPTWLPEPVEVREQCLPDPSGTGSMVVLAFDPRPDDPQPHDVLTLTESRAGSLSAESRDPQDTVEMISGHEVTIGRRGEGCVTARWLQADVALQLSNPYDPPGPPGRVRYSCEQCRRIIESVQ